MNDIIEIDAGQQAMINHYLAEYGYDTLEAWGADSDYLYDDEQDEWYDGLVGYNDGSVRSYDDLPPSGEYRLIRLTHRLGSIVDLRVQLLAALGEI